MFIWLFHKILWKNPNKLLTNPIKNYRPRKEKYSLPLSPLKTS